MPNNPKPANKNPPQFAVGMIVDCEMTYREFQGRIIRECLQRQYGPGDDFVVLSFVDGHEYRVSEYCMKRVIGRGPESADAATDKEPMWFDRDIGQQIYDIARADTAVRFANEQVKQAVEQREINRAGT